MQTLVQELLLTAMPPPPRLGRINPLLAVLLEQPWGLLIPALFLRWLPRPAGREGLPAPFHYAKDLGLAAVTGIFVMALQAFWLIDYYLQKDFAVTGSDFEQYCVLSGQIMQGETPFYHFDRNLVAAYLPGVLARSLGVLDALILSSLICSALLSGGIYVWARALYGRLAGLTCALLTGTVASQVILTHTATFYSQWAAAFTLTAALVAVAALKRTIPSLALGATGVGLSLLIDARGLIWALPGLCLLCLLVALPPWKRVYLRVLAVLLPLACSFALARAANLPNTTSLESQIGHYLTDGLRNAKLVHPGTKLHKPLEMPTAFVWGYSSPLQIPGTLWSLYKLSRGTPELKQAEVTKEDRQKYVTPWLGMYAATFLLCLYGLRRNRLILLTFLVTLSPFALALYQTAFSFPHPRMLMTATPGVPILLGLALMVVVQEPLPQLPRLRALAARLWQGGRQRILAHFPLATRERFTRLLTPLRHRSELEGVAVRREQALASRPVPLGADIEEKRLPGERFALAPWGHAFVAAAIILLVTTGIIPTWLSPVAAWRPDYAPEGSVVEILHRVQERQEPNTLEAAQCVEYLRADRARGIPLGGHIFPPAHLETR